MKIIKLDLSYFDQIDEIQQDYNMFAGVNVEAIPFYKQDMMMSKHNNLANLYLGKDNPQFMMWGYVDEETNILYSAMTQYFSPDTNMWYIQKAISRRTQKAKSIGNRNGLVEIMQHAIEFAEKRNCFQYIMAYPKRYYLAHKRIWPKYVEQRKERYDSVVINVIPPNTRPQFIDQWMWLMNSALWPAELVVTMQYLKPEFRQEIK
jgi:hypothetical protein